MDFPAERDDTPKVWRLRSGYLENWPDWKDHDIVSVGWDIGAIRGDVSDEPAISDGCDSLDEVESEVNRLIEERYADDEDDDVSLAYGAVKTVTATRSDRYFAPGDYVIVFGHKIRGQPVIHGVARLKEYVGNKHPISKESHPYQWEVEYLAKGPVRKHDLSEKFDGGSLNLFLRPTLWRFRDAKEEDVKELAREIGDLVGEKKDISLSQSYFDYKEIDMQRYLGDNINLLPYDIQKTTPEFCIDDDNRADFYCELTDGETLIVETKQHHATTDNLDQLNGYIEAHRKETGKDAQGCLIAPGFVQETIDKADNHDILCLRFVPHAELEPLH
ncbi:endonuclease NucS domain-containing protein [Halomarina rubra]|uniref:Endonuclease NucS domain-containing protein n=1 Tax=Halomarina rubra TaxID=2071873 RepID=A0ABD6AX59_9EURY|nr:endonuclease NucS domain-containing protein [Halomarina rubra]